MARVLLIAALSLALPARAQSVVVLDISAEDAVYGDIARELTLDVIEALNRQGLIARRIDESELPRGGCHGGPCLQKLALSSQADVLITLDAVELDGEKKTGVACTALNARTGQPLAGGRWTVTQKDKQPPKQLLAFVKQVARKAAVPDAGQPDAGR